MEDKTKKNLAKDKLEFVSSFITNKEGKVLLLKRMNTLKLDPGKYDLCSGHIKEGEAPTQAMYREIEEELGISFDEIKKFELMGIIETPHKKLAHTLTHIYDVVIDISEEELNKRVKNVSEPEIESVKYIDSIEVLRDMINKTEDFRTTYTVQLGYCLEGIETRIQMRKDEKRGICQEK